MIGMGKSPINSLQLVFYYFLMLLTIIYQPRAIRFLKQRIDKWGHSRPLGKDHDKSKEKQNDDHGHHPP